MRPAAIGIVGLASLLIVFFFVAYVQLILLCLGVIVSVVVVSGFRRGAHGRRSFWITTARKSETEAQLPPPNTVLNIEGRSFSVHELPERLEFTIARSNLYLVIAIALIAMSAVLACLVVADPLKHQIEPATPRFFLFYALCYLMVILLLPALAWLSECSLMRSPGITLANVVRQGLWTVYQFTDAQGGYYGGSNFSVKGRKDDHLKVVFCMSTNPSVNKLSRGLLFHEVTWASDQTA